MRVMAPNQRLIEYVSRLCNVASNEVTITASFGGHGSINSIGFKECKPLDGFDTNTLRIPLTITDSSSGVFENQWLMLSSTPTIHHQPTNPLIIFHHCNQHHNPKNPP